MERKGQGALEYLLLIGGAVMIASVVIIMVTTMGQRGVCESKIAEGIAVCSRQPTPDICNNKNVSDDSPFMPGADCQWNDVNKICELKSGITCA
jgi:hypothetical protein